MDPRLSLNELLKTTAERVYFDPPDTLQMVYPCITYTRDKMKTKYAGDKPYSIRHGYQVTVIDRNPDSDIVKAVSALPMCTYSSGFITENLHHDVFSIYF